MSRCIHEQMDSEMLWPKGVYNIGQVRSLNVAVVILLTYALCVCCVERLPRSAELKGFFAEVFSERSQV